MQKIRIVWEKPCGEGHLELRGGAFASSPAIPADAVEFQAEIVDENVSEGDFPTLVRVLRGERPFTFFLRDVLKASPIWYPLANCAVTMPSDSRSYDDIVSQIRAKGLESDAERMEREPEETFDGACRRSTLDHDVPVWLGLARDARFFRVNRHVYEELSDWGEITVWNHARPKFFRDRPDQIRFIFEVGPGSHGCVKVTRRLHDGVLPILHVTQFEQSVDYEMTFFVTRLSAPLSAEDRKNIGTPVLDAYSCMNGHNLKPEELPGRGELDTIRFAIGDEKDPLVCWCHVEAVNRTETPAYAFFRTPHLCVENLPYKDGILSRENGEIFAAATLDGVPVKQMEMAVLIPAGGRVVCDWRMAHDALNAEQGRALLAADYQAHFDGALAFWRGILADQKARISVPEREIQERLDAGVLHLELNTLGEAAKGPLLAGVGVYCPIGTESSPIIQYLDAVGRHETAARCIEWFLQRQKETGYINSYSDYESETGPVLWCVAEHYRVTRDNEWLRRILPLVEKSAEFLLKQRRDAAKDGGLVAGKCSDPKDATCAFFMNAAVYLGISGLAEALEDVAPKLAGRLREDIKGYRADIRRGLERSAMESPLVPLLDGSWTPALGPWPGVNGNVAYHADGGEWFSHGTIFGRLDSGAMALFLTDALPADDPLMTLVLNSHQHPHFRENCGLSQPYYFRHDIAHLKRGETKLFLKCFYNQVVSIQDRQSYTFWEHYFHVSSHKTHEEGWFLMQCRWMLALEEAGGITFLKGIPRKWLEAGKEISFTDLQTYFGSASVVVRSTGDEISGTCSLERPAAFIRVRIPHPEGKAPIAVSGGKYDSATETLTLDGGAFALKYC